MRRIGNVVFWSLVLCISSMFLVGLWRGAGAQVDTSFYSVWLSLLGICLYCAVLADWRILYGSQVGERRMFAPRRQLAIFISQTASRRYAVATRWTLRAGVFLFAQAVVLVFLKAFMAHAPITSIFHNLVPPDQ